VIKQFLTIINLLQR